MAKSNEITRSRGFLVSKEAIMRILNSHVRTSGVGVQPRRIDCFVEYKYVDPRPVYSIPKKLTIFLNFESRMRQIELLKYYKLKFRENKTKLNF